MHLFDSLNRVRELTYGWLHIYNETRPRDVLGRVPPAVFRRRLEDLRNSTFELSA